jgi:uncharacterized protein (DUF302 family)
MNQKLISPNARGRLTKPMAVALILFLLAMMLPATVLAKGREPGPGPAPEPVLVVESNRSFPETLRLFQEEVGKAGWSVLNVNNMAGVLSERGYTLHPVVILDVCSGKYSAAILRNDDYRPVSAFMPCRVSIYQTSSGQVFISRMNSSAFAGVMPPEVAKIMADSEREVSEIIAKTIR